MAIEILKTTERIPNLSRGELMRERKGGRIPAVMFGHGMDSVPLFVNQTEFNRIFDEKGKIFEIKVAGKKRLVNTKTVQWDPQRKHIWHIDFQALKKGVETTVKVPLKLVGDAAGVKEGGTVQQTRPHLEITGKPMDIPEELEVDVSSLSIGDNLHVSDLKMSGKFKIETEAGLTIATVVPPQKVQTENEEEKPQEDA